MKKLIKIVKTGMDVKFLNEEGRELTSDDEVMSELFKYIANLKKDGTYVLSAMPEKGFNLANEVITTDEYRKGLDYDEM